MIESNQLKTLLLDTIKSSNLIRVTCATLIIILILDLFIRRLRKYLHFKRTIDKLPGPQTVNPILGNIPASVLSLLTGNKTAKEAGEFYSSQIQSVLGHTLIYKDKPLFRLWLGQEPVVCVWKPEMVELVLNDSFLLEK